MYLTAVTRKHEEQAVPRLSIKGEPLDFSE